MQLPSLSANPQVYDYIHDLRFEGDGTVELIDGAGQAIATLAHGRYQAREIGSDLIEVVFDRLAQVNPYAQSRPAPDAGRISVERIPAAERPKVRDIPGFAARCARERGPFAFLQQGHRRIADEDEWPYLLFAERYVFEADPLAFSGENQRHLPYYRFESAQHIARLRAHERFYYPREDARQLPWREVAALGLTKQDVLG